MEQRLNPPKTGLVLEIGSGENPNPRSNVLVDRFLFDNTERFAREQGLATITVETLYDAKAHFSR